MGAVSLQNISAAVEKSGKEGDLESLHTLLPDLKNTLARTIHEIDKRERF